MATEHIDQTKVTSTPEPYPHRPRYPGSIKTDRAITPRAVLLGLALVPLNAYTLIYIEIVRHQAYPTSYALFGNVVAILAALLAANAALRRRWPRFALATGELLTCYLILCAASAISNDQTGFLLVGMLGHVAWFATASNRWLSLFGDRVPSWLVVKDRAAVSGFYIGQSSPWSVERLGPWLPALGWWLLFLTAVLVAMLCINVVVRKPWTEAQRLSYPIITVPIRLVEPQGAVFRSRWLWGAFCATVAVDLAGGIHMLYPAFPQVVRYADVAPAFAGRPWSSFLAFTGARVPLGIFPFIFGLGLLMPLDLCFSCWFLYLATRLLAVYETTLGWDGLPGFPYDADQASGAFLGIFVYLCWQMRGHFAMVVRTALRPGPSADDAGEPVRYRTALLGLLASGAFIVAFAAHAGMSPSLALLFFGIYFALAVSITRMRAEAGVVAHDIYLGGPDSMLASTVGTRGFSPGNLTAMTLFFWLNRAYDAHPMPQQLEGLAIARRTGISMRGTVALMLVGGVAGGIAAMAVTLHVMYGLGAASGHVREMTGYGGEPWVRLDTWTTSPSGPNLYATAARIAGLLGTLLLYAIRNGGIWCPLHPIGIAMAGAWSMYKTWSSLLLAWLVKWLALRYGGRRSYATLIELGIGLILGDCVMGGLWAVWGAATNTETFNPWP